jgi:hypothetical protein
MFGTELSGPDYKLVPMDKQIILVNQSVFLNNKCCPEVSVYVFVTICERGYLGGKWEQNFEARMLRTG